MSISIVEMKAHISMQLLFELTLCLDVAIFASLLSNNKPANPAPFQLSA